MPDGNLKTLIQLRAVKRTSITKTHDSIGRSPRDLPTDGVEIAFFIQKLTNVRENISEYDQKIQEHLLDDKYGGDLGFEDDSVKSEAYLDVVDKLLSSLKEAKNNVRGASNSHGSSNNRPKIKLPQVELPSFSGRPEEYARFVYSFEAIIDKFDLTQFERYSYLLQQLSGSAKEIVNSVPQTEFCYDTAINLLAAAFSEKIVQQFSVIEKLVSLRLNGSGDFHHWASEVRILMDQLSALNITSKIFAQYFIWQGLNTKYKESFMAVTNQSKPDIDEIIEHSFAVASRVGEAETKSSCLYEENYAMATNVAKSGVAQSGSNIKRGCQLCHSVHNVDASNHKIHNCTKFSSPASKLSKIKDLDGCSRCGLLNHTVSGCNYRFASKCGTCNSWHAFFLCLKEKNNSGSKPEKSKMDKRLSEKKSYDKSYNKPNESTTTETIQKDTHAVNFTVMSAQSSSDVVVPTFSVCCTKRVKGKGKKVLNIRALYDPASQVTFIASNLVDQIEHKVVKENVNIQITGFNESKCHRTKIIECNMTILKEVRVFQAVVVPEIRSKLPIAALQGVWGKFVSEAIPLADKQLNKYNEGYIGILLGVDFAHILPVQSCSFGGKIKSLVYHTGLGIMLAGNINVLRQNLPYLGSVREFVQQIRRNK